MLFLVLQRKKLRPRKGRVPPTVTQPGSSSTGIQQTPGVSLPGGCPASAGSFWFTDLMAFTGLTMQEQAKDNKESTRCLQSALPCKHTLPGRL